MLKEVRYNKLKKTHLTLNEGEEFCNTCRGEGMVKFKRDYTFKKSGLLVCKDCLGTGKIDWIEKVTGKKSHLPLVNLKIEKTKIVPRERKLNGDYTIS
jgi:DnaJ-class molecular chaperone